MVISALDRQIMTYAELQAEIPVPQLAKQMGLRPHAVYYGLNKLEREGILRKVPFINMQRLGYSDYLLLFSLALHDPKSRDALITYLQKNPPVTWLAELGGDYQYGAALYVRDSAELTHFLADLAVRFGGLFFHKAFSLHTRFARFTRSYLHPSAPRQVIENRITSDVHTLNEVDNKILIALTEHANKTPADVARLLDIPLSTLHYRLQTLKKQGVLDRQVYFIDTSKLNIQSFELLVFTKGLDPELPDKLFAFAKKHPHIVFFIQCIGSWDFELGIEVETMSGATEVVQEIYAAFADTITTITTLPLFRQLKFKFYRPGEVLGSKQ